MATESSERPEPPIRFIVDDHLRRLARWLRSAGFDSVFEDGIANRELYRRSWTEKRTILTMNKSLWAPRLHRLTSQDVSEQFRDVIETFALDPYEFAFRRCVICNVPLERVEKEDVADRVPPKAFAHHDVYRHCPVCDRVFWRGTHTTRTLTFFFASTGIPVPARFSDVYPART
ncbi:MAG: Mut7-C RNAse domain-containing protein [Planctomycetota bacterium]